MARNRLLPILIVLTPVLMASNCRKPPQNDVVTGTETLVQSPESALQVAVVEPSFGTAEEAFEVEVIGTGFENMARVRWSDVESPRVRFLDENTLLATVPALREGSYDVRVINPDGSESTLRSGLALRASLPDIQCEDVLAYFDYNSDEITEDGKAKIKEAAECLSQVEGEVVLEGHTDERGTTRYNLALGQRRAESAKRLLVSQGVSPNRARSVSYGEERPAEDGASELVWSKNRRVVISWKGQ